MAHAKTWVAFALLTAATGCTWKEDGLARLDELYPPAQGSSNPSSCVLPNDLDAGTPDVDGVDGGMCLSTFQGQWAARLVQFGTISPIGIPWNLTATDLFLVSLSSDKSSLELTFCGEENPITDQTGAPVNLGQTTVPPALTTALALVPIEVPLQQAGGPIATNPVTWLWGLRGLENPQTDPLPTTPDAGTVWDQDMDGEPGVTLDVTSPAGERYMVKRAIFTLGQTNFSPGWITGPLQFSVEQNSMGATSSVLATVAQETPRSECTSVFQMVCVSPTFTCPTLVTNYQTMFVNAP